ncbi:MAG: hypothetical protein HZB23_07995 [Deltaproteobacteria bacterium]|nr:hypothetical protein [Deltaproteobacteria bacterium]
MSVIKSIALFILKSASFSIILMFTYIIIMHQYKSSSQDMTNSYYIKMNAQIDANENLQKKSEKIITMQEEHQRRFDAVLSKWEQQTGIRPR